MRPVQKKSRKFLLKIGIFFALFGCSLTSKTTQKGEGYTVAGQVVQQRVYCGGARPTREMLDKLTAPIPYPNKTFYVRKGKTNMENGRVIAHFTTDKGGFFSVELPRGIYSIILEEQLQFVDSKLYKTKNQKVDEDCLAEWWKKPYYILDVQGPDTPPLTFIFTQRCFLKTDIPCVTYTGPIPH